MSSEKAIAAVTRKLRALIDRPGDGVVVTAKPPDEAAKNASGKSLNLFLYQVRPNASARNTELNIRPGESGQAPLALDLRYVLTAFLETYPTAGASNHQFLGEAMRILHDNPFLDPGQIELSDSDATTAVLDERVSVILETPSTDDVSKWWGMFSTPYRISAFYQVSVVLLESKRPPKTAAPVAKLGEEDRGPVAQGDLEPPVPTLQSLSWDSKQPTVALGNEITLAGHHLAGEKVILRFENPAIPTVGFNIVPSTDSLVKESGDRKIVFQIPKAPNKQWPAGQYQLKVVVTNEIPVSGNGAATREIDFESNAIPFSLAPKISQISDPNEDNDVIKFAVTCKNFVFKTQRTQVLVGSVPVTLVNSDNDKVLQVKLPVDDIVEGTHPVRLRVDGVDSHLIKYSDDRPPEFDETQIIEIETTPSPV